MPPFRVNSASPSHPRTHGSPQRWPCSHHGWSCVGFGGRYTPHRLGERFRSNINVRGTRIPLRPARFAVYASPVLFVELTPHDSATDATLATGGWLDLTRRGLTPRKMHQASLGTTNAALQPTRPALRGSTARPPPRPFDSGHLGFVCRAGRGRLQAPCYGGSPGLSACVPWWVIIIGPMPDVKVFFSSPCSTLTHGDAGEAAGTFRGSGTVGVE
jgi:hypothetical protein